MTKEQIEQNAEEYADGLPCINQREVMKRVVKEYSKDAYINGALSRQSEIDELKKENELLKEKVGGYERTRDRLIEMGFPTLMSCKEYAAQIEKMKCCANCKYKDCNKTSQYQTCWYCKNKNKWELKE